MDQRTLKQLMLFAFCLAPALFSGSALAAESSINVSVSSSDIVIDMDSPSPSGTFKKSDSSTVSISTDNYTGYTFSISAVSDTNSSYLINDQDSNSKFTSISEATTEAEFKAFSGTSYNGLWGYLPSKLNSTSNTDFLPAPSTTGDLIDKTSAPNSTANNYDIAIGARADFTMKVGDYSNHYALLVVANAIPYTIIYNDSVVTNMPVDVDSTSMTSTVTISNNTPVRDGYTFGGWCTVQVADNESCTGTTYAAGSTYTLDQTGTNNLQLYAMWSGSGGGGGGGTTWANAFAAAGKSQSGGYYYIQDADASICENVAVDETISVKDKRDDEVYLIGKLKDNRCWLLDNLRLDLTTVSLANLQGNTNASNTTLGYLKNGGGSSPYTTAAVISTSTFGTSGNVYTAAKINTVSKDTINSDSSYNWGDGSHKYGIYYNYCAASAGSYCYASGSGADQSGTIIDAAEDICPSNWRLPTGGYVGEYLVVAGAYANNNDGTNIGLKTALSLPLSGRYYNSSANAQGSIGHFWSSTLNYGNYMYFMSVYSSYVNPMNNDGRNYGNAVRCLLRSS